ncbi:hypothetical protein PVMG_04608 [Plasmodium vivax Mauritania I]|uniref:Uncharacterized protein n=1 Tax=Plasmodium vivax Mauritania I TaxID=1035515 RepID=A0A0J9VQY2_PLAVI|nr:hypothetical protein PVMG_04608 [Plasmodium vivax Mauritania I]
MNMNVRNYSFLRKVWTTYDEFNSKVNIYAKQHKYLSVCKLIFPRLSENEENQENFCMKLIRNLGHYDVDTSFFDPSYDRCHILYNWIYNTIENSKNPNELINKCFEDYSDQIINMKKTPKCSYDLFNSTYLEPRKITILKIFDDNIRDIIDKLNEEYSLIDPPSQKYVCECVKIYKEIKNEHCSNVRETDIKRFQTCQMLNTFNRSYMGYIYNNPVKKYNVPSLENVEDEYKRICQKNQHVSALTSSDVDSVQQSTRLTTDVNVNPGTPEKSDAINGGDQANLLSPTVSTALGTVAGASSLLALLYKVTQNFI